MDKNYFLASSSNIQYYIYWIKMDLEPIPGTLSMRNERTLNEMQVHWKAKIIALRYCKELALDVYYVSYSCIFY